MLTDQLKKAIETYPNFPTNGIMFKDLTPILRNPDLFNKLIHEMSNASFFKDSECIVGIDARGFIFASGLALLLSKPLVLARKPGKLPGNLIEESYELEYGINALSMQSESLKDYKSFAIVDDLLATGGTVNSVAKILKNQKKIIKGLSVVVELNALKARSKFNFKVSSIINYSTNFI